MGRGRGSFDWTQSEAPQTLCGYVGFEVAFSDERVRVRC